MKKFRFLVLVAILAGAGIVTSSSKNPRCGEDGIYTPCPIGMVCENGECIAEGGGDMIPCFSEFKKNDSQAVVDCSTCQTREGWESTTFATESRCNNGNGPQ